MATRKHDPRRMAALDLAIAAACVAEASAQLAVLLREGVGRAHSTWQEDYARTRRYLTRANCRYLTKAAAVRAHLGSAHEAPAEPGTPPTGEHGQQ